MLKLREAEIGDSATLFEWTNDPGTREMSFSPEKIEWEDHIEWLERKLSNPGVHMYIASDEDGNVLGLVRFDLVDRSEAEIHVLVSPAFRGRGIAAELIRSGIARLHEQTGIAVVHAAIKLQNSRSRRAFLKSGFQEAAREPIKGCECVRMIREIN